MKTLQELEQENNQLRIKVDALERLRKMDGFVLNEVGLCSPVIVKHYYSKNQNLSGVEFLRDAVRYINARNEALNEDKTWFQLVADFARKVDFDKTIRF